MEKDNKEVSQAYLLAQRAIADLKSSVYVLLDSAQEDGMRNSEVGRRLGIYSGHIGHEGHISRTILQMMQTDGTVEQDSGTKRWKIRQLVSSEID